MGTIRFLLALSVIAAHSGLNVGVGGRNAVQAFFLISGFLISYVLTESSSYSTLRNFYTNRFLRIYPLYYLVAILSLVVQLVLFAWNRPAFVLATFANAPLEGKTFLFLSNAIVFFQDSVMFAGTQENHLVFAADYTQSEVPLWLGLLLPQAWSLGVELTFYLVAPFLLKSKFVMVIFFSMSVLLRVVLISNGIGAADPWTYRFFPTELSIFLLGAFVHQIMVPIYKRLKETAAQYYRIVAIIACVGGIVSYTILPAPDLVKTAIMAILISLSLPGLFHTQLKNPVDSWLAHLSYPMYLWHLLVILVIQNLVVGQAAAVNIWCFFVTVTVTVLLSLLSNKYLDTKVEKLRTRWRR